VSESWLEERLEIFEEFTMPSVNSQTDQDFQWLVLCDSGSPQWFRSRLARNSIVQAIYLDRWDLDEVRRAVQTRRRHSKVVTTRLDNDDAIASDFVERVKQAATQVGFINFPHGLIWNEGRLYRWVDQSNAFISRVEEGKLIDTVYADKHASVAALGVVNQVTAGFKWLQVVHGGNLGNYRRGILVHSSALQGFKVHAEPESLRWAQFRLAQGRSLLRTFIHACRRPRTALRAIAMKFSL